MAKKIQGHHIQWFEDFAFKIEKLTIFTIIFLPKYIRFCAPSLFLSTIIYRFCFGFHLQHGLKPSDKKYYEGMFWVERVAMLFLALRGHHSWGWFLWTLALAFFTFTNVVDLSNQGNLSQKVLMTSTTNPRVNPRLEQGYIFWLERVAVIVLAVVPFNCLVEHYYLWALGLFVVPAIVSYISEPENSTLSHNSGAAAKELGKEIEKNKEVAPEFESLSLVENHLFWFERVAIFSSILFSARREILLIVSGAFHALFSLARHDVNPSPIEPDFLFWIERAAMIFLSGYGSDGSACNWYIAASFFAITNVVYFINPLQHLLQIIGTLLEECKIFDELEEEEKEKEEKEVETLEELRVEIKMLRSENNDLKREISLWDQELKAEIKRLISENNNLKNENSLWDQELERVTLENEEHKRLMREREGIWNERFDKAVAELLLEKTQLVAKLDEASSQIKVLNQEANFLVSALGEGARWADEKRELAAMLGVAMDTLDRYKAKEAEKEREAVAERSEWGAEQDALREKIERRQGQLFALENKVAKLVEEVEEERELNVKLSEEVEKLEEKCELYRNLLHDQDINNSNPSLSPEDYPNYPSNCPYPYYPYNPYYYYHY